MKKPADRGPLSRLHKEELAGEHDNYIHNRTYVEGGTPMQVLTDIGRELLQTRASIFAVLPSLLLPRKSGRLSNVAACVYLSKNMLN